VIGPDTEQLSPAPYTPAETTASGGSGVSRHAERCASGLGAGGGLAGALPIHTELLAPPIVMPLVSIVEV
jgi:hypothetical protein